MTLWLVSAGRYGEREDFAMEHNLAVIRWDDLPEDIQSELPLRRIWILLPEEKEE